MSGPMQKHHRRPKSQGGSNAPANITLVDATLHLQYHKIFRNGTAEEVANILNQIYSSYHALFGHMTQEEIGEYLNDKWICPTKMFICVDREDVAKIFLKQLKHSRR